MPIDSCPHTFRALANEMLPADMTRMRRAMSSPLNMLDFGTRGIGPKTILKKLDKQEDFSGCYVLLDGGVPVYVGISRSIVARLESHMKGADYYTATLAYRMAVVDFPHKLTANEAMKDAEFMRLFSAKRDLLRTFQVAFIEMHDPITMCLFEVYCAMELDTATWNSFRTH